MQKSVVSVWVNDSSCKQINVTPSSTCEDIIKYFVELYHIPKRASQHLELHVTHNGKDHSTVRREEKIMNHVVSLAEAGMRMDESLKNKYALVVNHDAIKKAQKLSGHSKTSWSPLSYFKKRTTNLQRSSSSEDTNKVTREPHKLTRVASVGVLGSASRSSPKESDSFLDAEKMPSSTPNSAPHLTPRLSISPPRAGMRARSKTLSPSLSTNDLRNQEALNQMITQRIKNRTSLSYERPPLTVETSSLGSEHLDQNSPRAAAGSISSGSPRSGSPPPPQRLFEPPPSIVHLSPSTSSSSISIASASLPATAPRQRSMTTTGVFVGNRLTPPRSQFAEITGNAAWKYDSSDSHSLMSSSSAASTTSSSSSISSGSSMSSGSLLSSSGSLLSSPPASPSSHSSPPHPLFPHSSPLPHLSHSSPAASGVHKIDNEHLELLAVVELLKKAT